MPTYATPLPAGSGPRSGEDGVPCDEKPPLPVREADASYAQLQINLRTGKRMEVKLEGAEGLKWNNTAEAWETTEMEALLQKTDSAADASDSPYGAKQDSQK